VTWDGNGSFVRTKDWTNDRDASIKILASRHDENDDELRDGIAATLTKDGQSKPTADFKPNADVSYSLGSAALRWVRAWISESIKWKQTNYTGTLNASTLTADRAWYLPDTPGVIVNTGIATVSPDIVNDAVFASDASDGLLPKLINLNDIANSFAGLSAFNTAASTTVSGKVELATSAETAAGSDAVRAVTPSGIGALASISGAKATFRIGALRVNVGSSLSSAGGFASETFLTAFSGSPLGYAGSAVAGSPLHIAVQFNSLTGSGFSFAATNPSHIAATVGWVFVGPA
jgi:hypothetical protein